MRARAFTLRGASFLVLFLRGGVYGAALCSLNDFRIDCRKLFRFSRSGNSSTTTTTRRRRRDVALSNDDCLAVLCRVRRHARTRRRWLARSAFNPISVVFVHGINDVTLFPRYVNKVCARRAFVVGTPLFVLAAIRSGSMYAVRLCEDLGLDPNEGVIRCSLAHYNTVDEVARLEKALEEAFR